MSATCHTVGSLTVVTMTGRLDAGNAASHRAHLREIIENGQNHVGLDLSEVTFVDSTGLSVLVTALKLARKADGDVVLLRPSPQVQSLIELTRLHHIFGIFDDEETAAAEFD